MNLASFFLRKNILIYFFKEFEIVATLPPPPPRPLCTDIRDDRKSIEVTLKGIGPLEVIANIDVE